MDRNINFMNIGNKISVLAVIFTIMSVILIMTKGFNVGVDFAGGIVIEISRDNEINVANIRNRLESADLEDFSVYNLSSQNEATIKIGNKNTKDQQNFINHIKTIINEAYPDVKYRKVDYVGPQVGKDLIIDSIIALSLGMIGIMTYLWFRFEWQYSVGAILALAHDAIMTLAFFSITGLEFNLTSIAAILTVVGYSVNDSVVIYDRIRENIPKMRKTEIKTVINKSINETLSRTTLTVVTTLLANLALILFGGSVLHSFSCAMFFGIIVGTYSSIFISAPVLEKLKLAHVINK